MTVLIVKGGHTRLAGILAHDRTKPYSLMLRHAYGFDQPPDANALYESTVQFFLAVPQASGFPLPVRLALGWG